MSWSASRQDLFRFGLPAAACAPDARQLDSITVAGSVFELRGHGFGGGERIRLMPRQGATLPAAIASPLTWYAVAATSDNDLFTLEGLTLADAGSGTIVAIEDFGPKIDDIMERRSSWLIAWYKASQGPWTTAPGWAPLIVAHLAAFDLAKQLRTASARYSIDDVRKAYDDVRAFLEKLDKGAPYDDGNLVDATPKVAEMGSIAVPLKGRGYITGGGGQLTGEREDRA